MSADFKITDEWSERRAVSALESRIGEFADLLERHGRPLRWLFVLFVFVSGVGAAAGKLFTYDEQITWRTARMPLHELLGFFRQGLDTTGPVPAILAHPFTHLRLSPEISLRIPFLIAFSLMCWGIGSFLRERYSAGFALAAIVLPVEFGVLSFFRTDARAYALMLCATGLGMRFWQLAAERRSRPWSVLGLWFVLALGTSAHLFTAVLFVPFALAQIVLDREHRRIDWSVWAALCLFPLGWLPFAPGERRGHLLYAGTFWSKPTLANLSDAYEQAIIPNWPIIFVLGIILLGLALWMRQHSGSLPPQPTPAPHTGFRPAEWTLVLALLALPVIAWAAAHAVGAFHHYYTASAMVGIVIALTAAVAELSLRRRDAGVAFFIVILGLVLADGNLADAFTGIAAIADHGQAHRADEASVASSDWVSWLAKTPLPVIAENSVAAKLNLYAPAELSARSFALTDFPGAADHPLAMTDQNNMRWFGDRLGFRSADIATFLQQHPHFLLVEQRPPYTYQWLAAYMLQHGSSGSGPKLQLRFISADGSIFLFDVCSAPSCPSL